MTQAVGPEGRGAHSRRVINTLLGGLSMSVRRVGAAAIMATLLTAVAIAVAPSPAGASLPNYEVVISSPAVAPAGRTASNFALCNRGKPLGGGVRPSTRNLRLV